jgi:hypothetical protein
MLYDPTQGNTSKIMKNQRENLDISFQCRVNALGEIIRLKFSQIKFLNC